MLPKKAITTKVVIAFLVRVTGEVANARSARKNEHNEAPRSTSALRES